MALKQAIQMYLNVFKAFPSLQGSTFLLNWEDWRRQEPQNLSLSEGSFPVSIQVWLWEPAGLSLTAQWGLFQRVFGESPEQCFHSQVDINPAQIPDPAGLRVKPTLKKDCCGFGFLGNINGTKKGNATEMKLISY